MRLLLLFLFLFSTGFSFSQRNEWYIIPEQKINLNEFYANSRKKLDTAYSTASFEISHQVTFAQYKVYLNAIKKDSGEAFYLSQLPDSNMCLDKSHSEYIKSKKYDDFPVAGVTWECAMNYCRWKTITDNKGDTTHFIYRLPYLNEWFISLNHFNQSKEKNDFNNYLSDWLIDSKDESIYDFESGYSSSFSGYTYFSNRKKDPPSMLRKMVIGDSYKFQFTNLIDYVYYNYYQYEGYAHVGFRYVKINLDRVSINEKFKDHPIKKYNGLTTNHKLALLEWKLLIPQK